MPTDVRGHQPKLVKATSDVPCCEDLHFAMVMEMLSKMADLFSIRHSIEAWNCQDKISKLHPLKGCFHLSCFVKAQMSNRELAFTLAFWLKLKVVAF